MSKFQGNAKRSWQKMKEITGKIKNKKALKINKKSLYSSEQISGEFNFFFTNVGLPLWKIFRHLFNLPLKLTNKQDISYNTLT